VLAYVSQLLTIFFSFYSEFLSKDCVDNQQQIGMFIIVPVNWIAN
jgi:hypothetical protein